MKSLVVLILTTLMLSGCSSLKDIEAPKSLAKEATLGAKTPTEEMLRSLGAAQKVITLSVYDFKDYTGQNKPAETAQYSRAVTQGGLAIVKKALLDAGNHKWFRVLERGALENLLQERKIIRSIRQQYSTADGKKLPPLGPLLYSGVLLEGGIIAYESNLVTGGIGARYLGIGASSQYRRDMVTVYLRAISVTTGEVLVSVNTSKTIYSTLVDTGIFKYVSFDKIVEGEAGLSFNEPPQLAVRQAIEMGVYALIMEGYSEGLWQFKSKAAGDAELKNYVDKYDNVGEKARARVEFLARLPKKPAIDTVTKVKPVNYSSMIKKPVVVKMEANVPTASHVQMRKPKVTARGAMGASVLKAPERGEFEKWPAPRASLKSISTPAKKLAPKKIETRLANGWYVQVASFSAEQGRQRRSLERYLSDEGFPVKIQSATIETQSYKRVLLGPFQNRGMANSSMLKVRGVAGSGNSTPFVKQIFNN